jgi:hypothetical protein
MEALRHEREIYEKEILCVTDAGSETEALGGFAEAYGKRREDHAGRGSSKPVCE